MKRRLFTILSGLSLLLFVAVVVLWVRSYRMDDAVIWHRDYATHAVHSYEGRLGYRASPWGYAGPTDYGKWPRWLLRRDGIERWTEPSFVGFSVAWRTPEQTWLRLPGSAFGRTPRRVPPPYRLVTIPYWFLSAMTALLPATWLSRYAESRRRPQAGLCPSCGYDLRATPGRCPECGLVPAAVPTTTSRGNVQ